MPESDFLVTRLRLEDPDRYQDQDHFNRSGPPPVGGDPAR